MFLLFEFYTQANFEKLNLKKIMYMYTYLKNCLAKVLKDIGLTNVFTFLIYFLILRNCFILINYTKYLLKNQFLTFNSYLQKNVLGHHGKFSHSCFHITLIIALFSQ